MKTENNKTSVVIQQLASLLNKGNAHVSLDDALKDIPFEMLAKTPVDLPYSIWQLAEHIRIAQWDILEFCVSSNHISPKWPEGYWPQNDSLKDEDQWQNCIHQIQSDRKKFVQLLHNAGDAIYTAFDYGQGQSLLKEALVLADHNSYHTAEIVIVRRILNIWR